MREIWELHKEDMPVTFVNETGEIKIKNLRTEEIFANNVSARTHYALISTVTDNGRQVMMVGGLDNMATRAALRALSDTNLSKQIFYQGAMGLIIKWEDVNENDNIENSEIELILPPVSAASIGSILKVLLSPEVSLAFGGLAVAVGCIASTFLTDLNCAGCTCTFGLLAYVGCVWASIPCACASAAGVGYFVCYSSCSMANSLLSLVGGAYRKACCFMELCPKGRYCVWYYWDKKCTDYSCWFTP